MVCNMATKKSGFPEQPVEKIRFEIFKKLSCLHFKAKFYDFWILHSSCKDVRKILLAFFRTGSSGSGNFVSVSMCSNMYLSMRGVSRCIQSFQAVNMNFGYFVQHISLNKKHYGYFLIPPSGQASGSRRYWKMQSWGPGIQSFQAVNMNFGYFGQHTSSMKKH